MKKKNDNKLNFNVLKISKINTDSMRKVEGGSSLPTITDNVNGVICDHIN